MLDEKDLQAIAFLLEKQKKEIISEVEVKMETQKKEIISEVEVKLETQKKEIIGEVNVLMECYFDPKFNLLAEKMASTEVVSDLDDRLTDLEDDVLELKRAQ